MTKVICVQTATVYWLGGGNISLSCSMYREVSVVMHTEIHTAEPLVPETSAFEVEMSIENLNGPK